MTGLINGVNGATSTPYAQENQSGLLRNQDTKILRFQTNVPVQLAYKSCREVQGRYGAQWMYSLVDGRIIYVER